MAKILVAEDDTFLSSLLVRALQVEGLDGQAAYDGVQAIEKAKAWLPDIMLLDILMPNKDGFDVLTALRSEPSTAQMRIIVLSNLGQPEDIDRAKTFGVTEYMVKANTTPHEVAAKIKNLLPQGA
jgi:CheY-like chemotaxis protein